MPKKDITTIKLSKNTKRRLDKLKISERESYEGLMVKILEILNLCRVNPEKAKDQLISIDNQRELYLKKS